MAERDPSIGRWAKWGMIAGWVLAIFYVNSLESARPVALSMFASFGIGGAMIGVVLRGLLRRIRTPRR